ncbi:MAG: HAMP domain-containing sensor histidine kinase [Clostridiales bacterium]|nr:HAMP domain-containing sensor histidine kinase [Clostridiales bacterium]
MLKTLRVRIVVLTMISITAVIFVISAAINVTNFIRIQNREDRMLDLISEYNGTIPNNTEELEGKLNFTVSIETPFQTRYFVIKVNEDGNIVDAKTSNIAAVGKGDIERLCRILNHRPDGSRGNIGRYRYLISGAPEGRMFAFLDCSQDHETTAQLVMVSIITSVVGLGCIFLIMVLVSEKIISPFVKNQEKQKQFITDAGHELKTPLAIIRTNAEVLEVCYGKNEWLDSIQNQTTRLDGLVKGLLQLSKSTELSAETEHIQFSLSASVSEITESFRTMAEQKGHKLHTDISPGIDYKGNAQSLSTLVSILIDNAIKYAVDNGDIYVSLSRMGIGTAKTAKLIVENDTDVDDSVDPNRFFERFYRSDNSRARSSGGYGIGLSVAKTIVEAHKGKITVSKNGNRIAFTAVL